jgi:3-phytase
MRNGWKPWERTFLILTCAAFGVASITEAVSARKIQATQAQQTTSQSEKENKRAEEKLAKEKEKREREEKRQAEKELKEKAKASSSENATDKAVTKTKTKKTAGPLAAAMSESMESVEATVETEPVPNGGDAADDPAIWINPADAALSTIIGTDKSGGLAVYDLSGKQIQYLPDGLMDNVDLRDNFPLGGQKVSIVTASNRKDNSIAIYKVNPQSRQLEPAAARVIKNGIPIYGMCMYRSAKTNKTYYFGTSKSGEVEQLELFDNGAGKVDAKSVRKFKVGTTVEGCVADDELGHFYVSEEAIGIWKYGAEPETGSTRAQVDKVGGGNLVADVEGLAIAYGADGKGYLMVSSQGNYSYAVYRREGSNEFVKKFRIGNGASIDGAEETDGIDVTTANLGPAFPNGVFVVQDGFNDKGNQNFKLVPFHSIIKQ